MLNEKDIKAIQWQGKDQRISLGDCLYLSVRKSSKTYLLVKRSASGKSSTTTLGRASESKGRTPVISLRQARQKAVVKNMTSAEQISTVTVATLTDKYWHEVAEPSYKRPRQAIGYYDKIKQSIGRRKVKDIKRAELVNFIQTFSKERGPRTADRLRSYLKMVFAYGVELGYIDHSPMDQVSKRVTGYSYKPRKRILSDDEIRWLFADNYHHKRALRFLLLTGLRIGEMRNGYVDGDKWRIDDTKGKHDKSEKRPHWVYLTESAKSCLPIKKVSNECVQQWLRQQQKDIDDRNQRWTPHDCRRTFATIASDNGVLPHVVEKCLNHVMEGMMAVYNHAEFEKERIDAAKALERAVLKIVNEETD